MRILRESDLIPRFLMLTAGEQSLQILASSVACPGDFAECELKTNNARQSTLNLPPTRWASHVKFASGLHMLVQPSAEKWLNLYRQIQSVDEDAISALRLPRPPLQPSKAFGYGSTLA